VASKPENEVLSSLISFYPFLWSSSNEIRTIGSVLEDFKGDKYKSIVLKMRDLYLSDAEAYNVAKRGLPAATFCATFQNERRKENLQHYNSMMILDIDHIEESEKERIKEDLSGDEFVFAYWDSPSGKGIKGLVPLQYDFDIHITGVDLAHKTAFSEISKYLLTNYGINLDPSGSDYTRLCFISWDVNLVLKKVVNPFIVREQMEIPVSRNRGMVTSNKKHEISRDLLFNPLGKNNPHHKNTIKRIINFLRREKLSITYLYDDWMKVGFALANSFTFDLAYKYFHELSQMDPWKYKKDECTRMLENCYHYSFGVITFKTIKFLASQQGYHDKSTDTGSTCPASA
jgi:hypothetical protein